MENHKRINRFLKENYGTSFNGRPKFRLVWSEDLFETRKGLHSRLAIYETVERKSKYMFFENRWVLEVDTMAFQDVFGKAISMKAEIVKDGDGYEPLRAFQTRKGEYLRPDLEVCKIICDRFVELINRPEGQRLTKKQASYTDKEKMKAEAQKFFELLSADDSDLIQQFRHGEAVIIHKST